MALTPAILIATQGLLTGDGLKINKIMTDLLAKVSAIPLIPMAKTLSEYDPNYVNNLPPFVKNSQKVIDDILTQANAMLPPGQAGIKSFISLFGVASGFGASSAQFSGAIFDFSGKDFKNLGIGAGSFKSLSSNNVNSILKPSIGVTGSSASITGSLNNFSAGLKNLGTAYDFKNPATLGPKNLVESLQKQGLADKSGINDAIKSYNYDPKNLTNVPDYVLISILNDVKGSDAQQVIKLLGVKPVKNINNLSDLLDPHNILPASVLSDMGVTKTGTAGMTEFGNKINNLGAPMTADQLQNLTASMEAKDLPRLDALSQPLPSSVSDTLKPYMGSGIGCYNQPTMADMLGTVAGETHIESFRIIYDNLLVVNKLGSTQNLETTMAALIAVQSPVNESAYYAAVTAFNNELAGSSSLSKLTTDSNNAVQASQDQLSRELTNLALAGRSSITSPNVSTSVTPILSFAAKLHTFGVDKQGIGYSRILENCVSDNLAGDAILSSLMEGRNLARTSVVGKLAGTVTNQAATDVQAATNKIPELQNELNRLQVLARDGSPEYVLLANKAKAALMSMQQLAGKIT